MARVAVRIAMLAACPFPTHQGSQVLIRHMATALHHAGHTVHLLTYGQGDALPAVPFNVHRTRAVDTGSRSGPHWRKPWADALLWRNARRLLGALEIDVLHAHNIEGLAVGALLRAELAVPLVYHCHNAMEAELPTYAPPAARWAARRAGRLLDHLLPRTADAVVTFDARHRQMHVANGLLPQRVHVIAPGIDPREMAPPAESGVARLRGDLGPGPWVLYAGNPDAYQNLPLLWRAFTRLRRSLPAARLLVATHHPAQSFGQLPDGAHVVRFKTLEELRALHAVAQVGVCPRSMPTGVPIKVFNYLAAGLAVVGCHSACGPWLTPETGIAVAAHADAMATGLQQALTRQPWRTKLPEHWHASALVPAYERLYAGLRTPASTARPRATSC